ncbi:hypothetical protein QVZ41_02495 [Wenyingzhuangia sp. chi5]|uniref:IPT/TIG domain-containing protein n=1 Tax=Wenyingzhuangia gilva TaxID=3057677 RepID=A0ABT8VP18_9FLAO|nr:hypothetical protein [Wenyingzhuangia sp. chi5]MDO3693715.1 hypothetical protein [Wenyingzhuangia sp. chi5]
MKKVFGYLLTLFLIFLIGCKQDEVIQSDFNYEKYATENLEIKGFMSLDSLQNKILRIDFDYKNLPEEYQLGVGYFLNESGQEIGEYQNSYSYQLIGKRVAFTLKDKIFENENYSIIPFIKVYSLYKDYFNDDGNNIYDYKIKGEYYLKADEIKLNSKFSYNVELISIEPKQAFVGDLLKIKGRNFCNSGLDFTSSSSIEIAGVDHPIVFKSDSLLLCNVTENLDDIRKGAFLKNCGMEIPFQGDFGIKKAFIDSVSSGPLASRETLKVYGDNFVPESFINGPSHVRLRSKSSSILYHNIKSQDVYGDKKILNLPLKGMVYGYGVFDLLLIHLRDTLEIKNALNLVSKPLDADLYLEEVKQPIVLTLGDTLNFRGNNLKDFYKGTFFLGKSQTDLIVTDTLVSVIIDQLGSSYWSKENKEYKLEIKIGNSYKYYDVELKKPQIINVSKESVNYDDHLFIEIKDLLFVYGVKVNDVQLISIESFKRKKDGGVLELAVRKFQQSQEGDFEIKIGNDFTGYDSVYVGYNDPEIKSVIYLKEKDAYLIKGKNFHRYGDVFVYIDGIELSEENFHLFYRYDDEVLIKLNIDNKDFKISFVMNKKTTNQYQF